MKTTEKNKGNAPKGEDMVFGWSNYKWMLAGVGVILLGFVLMWGGGSGDAAVFDYEGIFSWRRIGLAPIVVLAGFGIVGYSIFHKGRNKE